MESKKTEPSPAAHGSRKRKFTDVFIEEKRNMDDTDTFNGITALIIGKGGSGKSTFLKKCIIDEVYVPKKSPTKKDYIRIFFTASPQSDALKGMPKDVIVCPLASQEAINQIIMWCYGMATRYGKEAYNFILIYDDVVSLDNNEILENSLLTFRNSNITSILSLQYLNNVPKNIRGNINFLIPFSANLPSIGVLNDQFMARFLQGKRITEKMASYDQWTKNHKFYYLNNLETKAYRVDEHYNIVEEINDSEYMGEGRVNDDND